MRGTCDVCERENVELRRAIVSGIETFYCARCGGHEADEFDNPGDGSEPNLATARHETCRPLVAVAWAEQRVRFPRPGPHDSVIRAAIREVVCPVMWAELASIILFLGGIAVMAALLSGA